MSCFGEKGVDNPVLHYTVELLDGSSVQFYLNDGDTGNVLLEKVWNHLDLFEREYFGIRFLNTANKTSYWLDGQKILRKQLKSNGVKAREAKFYFGVKFYAIDPCKLKEELTRYQFFLQIRRDVATNRIPLNFNLIAELGGLVAQSEFGDYDRNKHKPGYLHTLKLTSDRLSDDLNTAITDMHRGKLKGVLPSQCEYTYLDIIKNEDVYGVEFYNTKGAEGEEYKVGVSPNGIVIYRGKHRVGLYHWPRIDVINFKGKQIILQVRDKFGSDCSEHTFTCSSSRVCKQLWKSSVEHHSFFRLSENKNLEERNKSHLFKLGSKYRYSGRTEKELALEGVRKEQPTVQRPYNPQVESKQSDINNNPSISKSASMGPTKLAGGSSNPVNGINSREGMFTPAAGSPGSVRSLKMKFQSKSTDVDADVVSNRTRTPRTPRANKKETEKSILKSGRSDRRRHSYQYEKGHLQQNQAVVADDYIRETSTHRIVRSYIPPSGGKFYPSDVRRHSDRQLGTKWREYENIVYNDQGLPVILATHRGEKADEKMPFYQQNWLQGGRKPHAYNREPAVASILTNKQEKSMANGYKSSSYRHDPLLQSLIQSNNNTKPPQNSRKPSLSFYEEQLMNRDSGTDSPTANYYDDQNIYSLIKSLGHEAGVERHHREWDISTKYGGLGAPPISPTSRSYSGALAPRKAQQAHIQSQDAAYSGVKSSPIKVTVI